MKNKTALLLLLAAWALAVLPNLTVRSFVWEEGRSTELARDTLLRGDLLEPAIYGFRWVEKPPLHPWMIAGVARLTGQLNEWSARLPTLLAVLLTALLVFYITRRYATPAAALFAAASFLFCPLLLRKLTIAEPDTIITVLIFGALALWWDGVRGRLGWWRGVLCGLLLAIAALTKGPQPIAYFGLGVGGYLLARRRWSDLPALMLALALPAVAVLAWAFAVYRPGDLSVWLNYMRVTPRIEPAAYLIERVRFVGILLLDLLPPLLLLPFFWKRYRQADDETAKLGELLLCYAGGATLVLTFWPGANTRYAMPAVPALCVMAGLVFDDLWQRRHLIVRSAIAILVGLLTYQFALVWIIMPMFAPRFGASRTAGYAIDRTVGNDPAPIYHAGMNSNQLFYVSRPIRFVSLREALMIEPPAWLILPRAELEWIKARKPGFSFDERETTTSGPGLIAVRMDRTPESQ